jgi:hypothetical protein
VQPAELAREVVLGPTRENVIALAEAVLEDELVRLAREVLGGGPHAVRRAIELAALVLAGDVAGATKDDASSR